MEQNGNGNNGSEGRDMLYLMGGLALMILGAGLVMSHPTVRKTVSTGVAAVLPNLQGNLAPDLTTIGNDLQRYMKLRSM